MDSIEWLKKLIAYDTTSRNSNLPLISAVQDYLSEFNIPFQLTYDQTKQKANLFATIAQENHSKNNGIIFSGHTDVVPVDGQSWETNPFIATEKENRIYGRGAADMKGFLAVVLSLVPEFIKAKLKRPIHLAFSYDEEVGCKGAPHMIEHFLAQGFKPASCIVGEPTDMKPIIAHKGINLFRCRIQGLAAHSSLTTQGCNAIDYASQFIERLRDLADQIKREGPFDSHYDVPFTTLSTNIIKGGNAVNTIPAECEILFDVRLLPEVNVNTLIEPLRNYIDECLLPKMQTEFSDAKITLDCLASAPAFEGAEQAEVTQRVRQITQEHGIQKVAYATEAGLFQKAGIETILCGPGNIKQAHGPNEYIEISQLKKCEEFLLALAD